MKYIIVACATGMPIPLLFPEEIAATHQDIASAFGASKGKEDSLFGAGFCYVDRETGRLKVYGESVSLKMKATEEDEKLLNKLFFGD